MRQLLPPVGVFPSSGGAEVRVFSQNARQMDFCLFDHKGLEHRFPLERGDNGLWTAQIAGARPGMAYGLRAHGPHDATAGHLFDPSKLLVDPMALTVDRVFTWHPDLANFGRETAHIAPRTIITTGFPEAIRPVPHAPRCIYELQVRSFSKLHPAVPEAQRGTFAALAHPAVLDHFKRLGVDTLEIMPMMAWADERHLAPLKLSNAWGYNPYCFGAPEPRLAPGGWPEIISTLKALHAAGLQVVLDVVFNHTGESDLGGPTLSLRGLDNASYYRHSGGQLVNDTGCGNTLDADNAAIVSLVLQSLRLWAAAGFDGFRYDLATVMGRSAAGFAADHPLLEAIRNDASLALLLHIAEPWDIGPGGYQLGNFSAGWMEWNDHFRDDVRRFWRGDGSAGDLATRLAGSSDIFGGKGRRPSASINFLAAHDGFTLADCTHFAGKKNFANGEGNRDGSNSEVCWVSATPERDVRAMLATLLFSRGTPMLTAGDEFGRSQRGNNNAYAQDNELTWLDWSKTDDRLITDTAQLISNRAELRDYFEDTFFSGQPLEDAKLPDVQWLDSSGLIAHWQGDLPVLGMAISSRARQGRLLVYFNRSAEDIYCIPPAAQAGLRWQSAALRVPARSAACWREEDMEPLRRSQAPDDEAVRRLALAAGLQPEWWEVNGTHHAVSVGTQRALLGAMGLSPATRGDLEEHMASLLNLRDDNRALACHASEVLASSRFTGLSTHLYALRHNGDWGIGDFETLAQTAEAAGRMGCKLLGINPLHHMFTDDRERVSPYQPSDRRFIDPIYIDVEAVNAQQRKPPGLAALRALKHVDYAAVWNEKDKVLRRIFASFKGSHGFDSFLQAQGEGLKQHARFEARQRPGDENYAMWLQWVADQQLAATAERARSAGLALGLYRDLALGCAYEGGEVWSNPGLYCTQVSIGAPPDPFSADGQVWNLPPFNPLDLARRGYQPLADILCANMRHAGVLRIDHVLGLARQFWVPRGASGADGAYVSMPLNRLMSVVATESQRAGCVVIGEDLGTVPDGFRERIHAANMLSYRVLWFEQDERSFASPSSYPRQAAVCLSSHDLLPFRGWERGASTHEHDKLRQALAGESIATSDMLAGAHDYVARTPCAIMLVQADDLSGETEPLNVPGTDKERPNWRRRLGVNSAELPELPATLEVMAALRRTGRLQ